MEVSLLTEFDLDLGDRSGTRMAMQRRSHSKTTSVDPESRRLPQSIRSMTLPSMDTIIDAKRRRLPSTSTPPVFPTTIPSLNLNDKSQ